MANKSSQNPVTVRINNRKNVLDYFREAGEVSIAQLVKDVGLSKTTLGKIISHLQNEKYILPAGKGLSTEDGGKKPELYKFNTSCAYTISIALYGPFILMSLTDAGAEIFYKEKVFLKENEEIDRILGIIADFIRKWSDPSSLPKGREGSPLAGIVLAWTGVIDSAEGVCFTAAKFPSWPEDVRIRDLLIKKVQFSAPLYIDNYNRYFAFAEKTRGGYKDMHSIVNIVTSYGGLGAGMIEEYDIKHGPRFLTGEVGHLSLISDCNEKCYCGGRGCFEQLVTSSKLLQRAAEEKAEHGYSSIYKAENNEITLENIFTEADKGDEWAKELLDEVIMWFAAGIQNMNLVYNPDIFIISGDYRTAGDYFKSQL